MATLTRSPSPTRIGGSRSESWRFRKRTRDNLRRLAGALCFKLVQSDVNGDGKTDWITINPASGAINVGLSDGAKFNLWTWASGPVVGPNNENHL